MAAKKRASWDEVRSRRMKAPAARTAYDRARRAYELGEAVRRERERAGLSQRELAARMHSTQSVIARLEAGAVTPTLETLDRVAAALGIELTVRLRRPTSPRRKERAAT